MWTLPATITARYHKQKVVIRVLHDCIFCTFEMSGVAEEQSALVSIPYGSVLLPHLEWLGKCPLACLPPTVPLLLATPHLSAPSTDTTKRGKHLFSCTYYRTNQKKVNGLSICTFPWGQAISPPSSLLLKLSDLQSIRKGSSPLHMSEIEPGAFFMQTWATSPHCSFFHRMDI